MNIRFYLGISVLLTCSTLYSMVAPAYMAKRAAAPDRCRAYPLKRAVGRSQPSIPYAENIVDVFWESAASGQWTEAVSRNFLRIRDVSDLVRKGRSIGRSTLLHYAVAGHNVQAVRDVLRVIFKCRSDQRYKFLMAPDLENETALTLAARMSKKGADSQEIFDLLLGFKRETKAAEERKKAFDEMLQQEAAERRKTWSSFQDRKPTLLDDVANLLSESWRRFLAKPLG